MTPTQLATGLCLLHVLLWTALPSLVNANLPLDTIEALAWGREWQWGYHKHPPLSAWLSETARMGTHDEALYLLSQLMVAGGLMASWLLTRDLLRGEAHGERLALVAMAAAEGVHYYRFSSVEFNANVVMYPFWAGATLCAWRALRPLLAAQPAHAHMGWWLGLGACTGLGLLGKYVFALLPLALLVFMLLNPAGRRAWATPGPWLALALALSINLPHIIWAQHLNWPTLRYAAGRGQTESLTLEGNWLAEFMSFVVAQALALSPLWLLLRLLGQGQKLSRPSSERWLMLTLGLGPLLLLMLTATVAQARMVHMWATPFFICSAPLWLAWRPPAQPQWRRFAMACAMWSLLLLGLYAGIYLLGPQYKHRLDRQSYPGRSMAEALNQRWYAETGLPLRIVAGEEFVAGNVGHYAPDRPSVFYDADFAHSLWLSDAQVRHDGAVFVWPVAQGADRPGSPLPSSEALVATLRARYPKLESRPTLTFTTHWMGHPYTVAVAWALLHPEPPPARQPSPGS